MRQSVDHFELNSLSLATRNVALFQRVEGAARGSNTELLIGISLKDEQGWQNFALGDFIGLKFHIVTAGCLPRSIVPFKLSFERALPVLDVLRHARRSVYDHRRSDWDVGLEESKQDCGAAGRETEKPDPLSASKW